ncbi:MAG: VOC family protein [Parasphingopyxis sp.]|uniref:VOC family protein n=1 Tax=Parasphingopyxis sp. TaxID=1920299 RepID=UPI003F9EDDEC
MQMPNYLELATADMAATKSFYTAAFGVEFTDYGPEYAGANTDRFEIGLACFGETPPPLPGFQTDDIAAAEQAVRDAGGTIVRESYEFPGGRRFHFRDPGGNELLVYQYDATE